MAEMIPIRMSGGRVMYATQQAIDEWQGLQAVFDPKRYCYMVSYGLGKKLWTGMYRDPIEGAAFVLESARSRLCGKSSLTPSA